MRSVYDIVIRATSKGLQTTVNKTAKGFDRATRSASIFAAAMGKTDRLSKSLGRSLFTVQNALVAGSVGVFAKGLFDAGVRAQNIQRSFEAITGSTEAANKEIAWLRQQSKDLGLGYYNVVNAFKGITAGAKDSALEGEQTRKIFMGIAVASRALGLSSEQTTGALRALEQMISKGNVQAEELRGQLGERLPGAFNLAAEAMGVSTQQLNKMLKDGEVLAVDLLPKLADLLHKKYGQAAKAASGDAIAALNRFSDAWQDMKTQIAGSGFLEAAAGVLQELTDFLSDPQTIADIKALSKWVVEVGVSAVKSAIKYKELLLAFAGTVAAAKVFNTLFGIVKGLNLVFLSMTGMGIIAFFKSMGTAISAAAASAGVLGTAMVGVSAAYTTFLVMRAWDAFWQMRDAQNAAAASLKSLNRTLADNKRRFEEFKNAKLPDDLTGKTAEELAKIRTELKGARAYWVAMRTEAEGIGDTAGLEKASQRLKEITGQLKKLHETDATESSRGTTLQLADIQKLKTEKVKAAEEVTKALKKEIDKQIANEKRLVQELEDLEKRSVDEQMEAEDELRELRRRSMSEAQQQIDLEQQATEKLADAKAALAQGDTDRAEDLAKSAKDIFRDLDNERKAIEGVRISWQVLHEITAKLEADRRDELAKTQDAIKSMRAEIEKIERHVEVIIKADTTAAMNNVNALVRALARLKDKTITITTRHVTKGGGSAGGTSGIGMATGGKLGGYGGGDVIPALLEPGERITNKLSTSLVDRLIPGLMDGINRVRTSSDVTRLLQSFLPGFSTGALVPAAHSVGASLPQSRGQRSEVRLTLATGDAQARFNVSGDHRSVRDQVRILEQEMKRMGLSHR